MNNTIRWCRAIKVVTFGWIQGVFVASLICSAVVAIVFLQSGFWDFPIYFSAALLWHLILLIPGIVSYFCLIPIFRYLLDGRLLELHLFAGIIAEAAWIFPFDYLKSDGFDNVYHQTSGMTFIWSSIYSLVYGSCVGFWIYQKGKKYRVEH